LRGSRSARELARAGDVTADLDVILERRPASGVGTASYHHVQLPAGQARAALPSELAGERLRVVPDGDTYVVR
jgi:hypothetical protein